MKIDLPILMNNRDLRRKNPLIREHFEASEKEMEAFEKIGGLIRDSNVVDMINCPVCFSEKSKQLLVKWGGRYDECDVCGHVFLKNPFKQDMLTALYKSSIADELNRQVQKHSFNEQYWAAVYEKYMRHISEELADGGRLLDMGCGSGRFLRFCQENSKFELFALDVFDGLVEVLSPILSKENIFLVPSLEESDIGQQFGIITLWGVLEHCRSPHKTLQKCHDYLESGGHVLLLIPNIHSRARKLLGVYTPTLNPRAHINFFTPQSLEKVASDCGFTVQGFYQELPVIDLMWDFLDEDSDVVDEIIRGNECYYHVYILKKT